MKHRYQNQLFKLHTAAKSFSMTFLLAVVLLIFYSEAAYAQRGNQSDWNVPPPLPPGSITKGDTEGRPGNGGSAALTIMDVTAVLQPVISVSIPELPPISTTAPDASQPKQPAGDMIAALPDTPLPEMPETPEMPNRTLQDTPEPPLTTVPMPAVPELPAPPKAPVGGANPVQANNNGIPLMPEVTEPLKLTPPPAGNILWSSPGVPEIINFKLIIN